MAAAIYHFFYCLGDAVWTTLGTYISAPILPTIMQNVGIGLITIFIPVVIFLLEDAGKNELDRIVIMELVIQFERLFVGLCLIFLPLFLWMFEVLRWPLFIAFAIGVWVVVRILVSVYRWLRTVDSVNIFDQSNHRNKLRNEYLGRSKYWDEKERIWAQIWEKDSKPESVLDERNLIQKFVGNLNDLLEQGSWGIFGRFLRVFEQNMEKRALYDWPTFGDVFKAALAWHFKLDKKSFSQDDKDLGNDVFQAEFAARSVLQRLVASALKQGPAFILFSELKKHFEDKPIEYIERALIQLVCRNLFDGIESSRESYDIWHHYFPEEWKVTKQRLQDTDNLIPRIWFNQFVDWAQRRIWNAKKEGEFDKNLDDVAEELFPETDPSWWAYILIFLFSPWTNDDRIASLVRVRKTFGFASRLHISSGSADEASKELHANIERERTATIDFALSIFPSQFSVEKLEKYLRELEWLQLKEGSVEDLIRKEYQEIFRAMLAFLKKSGT